MSAAEQATLEELERVLRTERFATIHDLAGSAALREIAATAPSTAPAATTADVVTLRPGEPRGEHRVDGASGPANGRRPSPSGLPTRR